MKVAFYSPLPPDRSGVADYSALLLPPLQERLDVEVVRPGGRAPRGTDVALYHVGNNPDAHGWIFDALKQRDGVVVLHEFVLHHLIAGVTLGRGDRIGYVDAVHRDAGVVGRLLAHGVIDGVVPPLWEERPQRYPLATNVLDHATGVIVHSEYVRRLVRNTGYAERLWRIPMPAWPEPPPAGARELPQGRSLVVGCFGHVNFSKRVPELLEAFARVRERHPDALLVLGGSVSPGLDLDELLRRPELQLGESLVRLEHLDEPRLWQLLHDCDVSVNLRYPTMGETSGMVVRALSLGKPVIVSDVGSFSELPDEVAVKIEPGPGEVDALAGAFERLAMEPERLEAMSRAALESARTEHGLDHVVELYVAALEEAAGGEAVEDSVVDDVARAAHDVGLTADDPAVAELGERLRESGLGR